MDRTYDAVSITLIGESMEGNWLYKLLLANGWSEATAEGLSIAVNVALVIVILTGATVIIRKILLSLSHKWIAANRYRWDDALLKHKFLDRLSWFIPILLAHLSIDSLLPPESSAYIILKRMMMLFFVIAVVAAINAGLSTVGEVYRGRRSKQADVLKGFLVAGKIIT